jgi:tetratricopeptide (TPR) repeat protein
MSNNSGQWVIRIQSDQVKGPYSTDAINKMIVYGAFSGSEEICSYPEGEWKLLTKQPEFYDALLESLENPVEVDNKRTQKMEAETQIRAVEPAKEEVPIPKIQNTDDLKNLLEQERKAEEVRQKSKKNKSLARPSIASQAGASPANIMNDRDKNLEIQLTDIQKLQQNEIKKIIPFVLVAIILIGAVAYFFNSKNKSSTTGWALLAPQNNAEAISDAELKEYKRNAAKAFQTGILEKVLALQPTLVLAVEGAPKDLEALGLLCMVYGQIWPYTKQSQSDLKSILKVTQMARATNPISNYSDSCQTIFLLTKGQGKEARSLLEKALDNPIEEKFSLGAFLYLIKAEILESENNFINAGAYYDQAVKLWPQWNTARFGLARMYYKQGKFAEAREQYLAMYNTNKELKAALFGLALVELKASKDIEKALPYFSNGFEIKQKLPRDFLTEALFNYAQILMDRKENKKALEVAQAGYRESPSHRALKELVVTLGGDDKVENAQSEIMLIGDQFANSGDCLVAQAQYKAAFELDSNNAMAAFKAGRCLWKINQTRDAIAWLEKSIGADPNMLQAYVLKADYESQKYNFSNAARTLQVASRKFSQSHEITKAQALLEFRKNNMVGAIQYGERAVKIYNADVELLTLLARAHVFYYMNAPSVGKDSLAKKDSSKELALKYSGRAIDLEPAWPESQITYAKVMSASEGLIRGESYLKQLIKNYPYTIEYRVALAEHYKENEKYSDSATMYEEVVSIDSKNKKANFGLAETYRILNKPELAQRYYNLTSVLDPSDVEPMFANAKLLLETAAGNEVKAKTEQALAKLELVKKINPDFPKVSFLMAKCYLELNDYQKSMDMIKEEKSRNPNLADSFMLAAEIFYRKGQFKECAAEYSAAIKIRPSSAELYVKSAICYRNSDALEVAEDMLAIALQKESGYAEIYREQAFIFEKKGSPSQAVLLFKKYILLSPNAPDRDIVLSKIKQLGGEPD